MWVVIEGWRQLGLKDPKIDKLLESPNIGLLKQFRHGVFHFRKDYFDNESHKFIEKGVEAYELINNLRDEFDRYFLEWFNERGYGDGSDS